MKNNLQATRAITYIFAKRFIMPLFWISGVFCGLLIILTIFLAINYSPTWLWLLVLAVPITSVFIICLTVVRLVLQFFQPRKLSVSEQKSITKFVDKITRIIELRATPWPVVIFFVAKDILRGKPSAYLGEIVSDASTLKTDFNKIKLMFDD